MNPRVSAGAASLNTLAIPKSRIRARSSAVPRFEHVDGQPHRSRGAERPSSHQRVEGYAIDKVHRVAQVLSVFEEVTDRHDVRVAQPGEDFDFAQKTGAPLRGVGSIVVK
jgi:hypothetical protein